MWHIWKKGEVTQGFWRRETLRERDQDVDKRIILRWIFSKWEGDRMELAQDRDRWRAIVSTARK